MTKNEAPAIIESQSFTLSMPPSANRLWCKTKWGMRKTDAADRKRTYKARLYSMAIFQSH
jgi:hypothetical protein